MSTASRSAGTASACPDALQRLVGALGTWSANLSATARCGRSLATTPGTQALAACHVRAGILASDQTSTSQELRAVASAFTAADRARARREVDHLDAMIRLQAGRYALRFGLDANVAHRLENVGAAKGKLLRFDPRGDGRVVEVLGDLVDADHIAVLVPGMTNDIDGFWGQRGRGTRLLATMRAAARPGEKVAVVVWLGYDTPDGPDGALAKAAKAGAADLNRDLDLVARFNAKAHVTVVAHSYGTVVLGQAMRSAGAGLRAQDAVAVASPGMGADDRKELGSPQTKLYATRQSLRNPGGAIDKTPFAPVHGEDPAAKGFGAERFPPGPVDGHGGYFELGTLALTNIALVAVGKTPVDNVAAAALRPGSAPDRATKSAKSTA